MDKVTVKIQKESIEGLWTLKLNSTLAKVVQNEEKN